MASKRRNVFYQNKKQETTVIASHRANVSSICEEGLRDGCFVPDSEWILVHIGSLVHFGSLLIAVAMHNFSLAFLAGVVLTPMALALRPSRNGLLCKLLALVGHPMSLVAICVGAAALFHFPSDEFLTRTSTGIKQALVLGVVDSMVYGSWTLNVGLLFYLPNWLMFWIVAHARSSCLDSKPTEDEEASAAKKED
ncbi:hypothetical protein AAG570_007308 [Ranatra chinensis]|uniref:Uncharacterized protein n=1 Tax=Ranatra chinensis TaxID=642074 RepID=A0ABD0XVH0_9HEMI